MHGLAALCHEARKGGDTGSRSTYPMARLLSTRWLGERRFCFLAPGGSPWNFKGAALGYDLVVQAFLPVWFHATRNPKTTQAGMPVLLKPRIFASGEDSKADR